MSANSADDHATDNAPAVAAVVDTHGDPIPVAVDANASASSTTETASDDSVAKSQAFFDVRRTAPFDPRFPNVNQTKNCWTNYIDYFRCARLKGENDEQCKVFKGNYATLCPSEWTDQWDQWREKGQFPGQRLINK